MKLDRKQVSDELDKILAKFFVLAEEISKDRDTQTQEQFSRVIHYLQDQKLLLLNRLKDPNLTEKKLNERLQTFTNNCTEMIKLSNLPVEVKTPATNWFERFNAWIAELFAPKHEVSNEQANEKMKDFKTTFQNTVKSIASEQKESQANEENTSKGPGFR